LERLLFQTGFEQRQQSSVAFVVQPLPIATHVLVDRSSD
jgi:hypothetical protein